uniref:Caspase family p10 domain-containing protein n=1 Tax=Timema tahoe TaxID=61484 RepID=A0A7R9IRL2_9NEOP|nr:unnamed protein product [Timema tahoe]
MVAYSTVEGKSSTIPSSNSLCHTLPDKHHGGKLDRGRQTSWWQTRQWKVRVAPYLPLTVSVIHSQTDIMVANSTEEGYYSWRNPISGSWFIQALCEELKTNGTKRDLLTLLTFVCRRVALDYQSVVPSNYDMDNKKQVPSITSSLTRLVFFQSRQ